MRAEVDGLLGDEEVVHDRRTLRQRRRVPEAGEQYISSTSAVHQCRRVPETGEQYIRRTSAVHQHTRERQSSTGESTGIRAVQREKTVQYMRLRAAQ